MVSEFSKPYLVWGVTGESRIALMVTSNSTTIRHSKRGPKRAPSSPNRYIPPAIDRPVRYGWPPLEVNTRHPNKNSRRKDNVIRRWHGPKGLWIQWKFYIYSKIISTTYPLISECMIGLKLDGTIKCTNTSSAPNQKRSCESHRSRKAGTLHQ